MACSHLQFGPLRANIRRVCRILRARKGFVGRLVYLRIRGSGGGGGTFGFTALTHLQCGRTHRRAPANRSSRHMVGCERACVRTCVTWRTLADSTHASRLPARCATAPHRRECRDVDAMVVFLIDNTATPSTPRACVQTKTSHSSVLYGRVHACRRTRAQ